MAAKQHSTVTIAIAATIESAINNALYYDPASKRAVSELTDVFAIEVRPATLPSITFYCQGTADGVRIMSHCESSAAARLTGSPAALLGLLNRPSNLAGSGVKLSGDVKLLQRWQTVLDNLDIDWETCLQYYLGDIAGPVTATLIGKTGQWLQHQSRYHQHQLRVYLQEELRIVPPKNAFHHFHHQVDELILATDRVQARIQQLQEKLAGTHLNKTCLGDSDLKNSNPRNSTSKNIDLKNESD